MKHVRTPNQKHFALADELLAPVAHLEETDNKFPIYRQAVAARLATCIDLTPDRARWLADVIQSHDSAHYDKEVGMLVDDLLEIAESKGRFEIKVGK